uniref:DUF4585 domain-containing protein n=1 Tax=Scleropages formosus TaxID=113540 RepID=A0A8C9SCS3_SCLFO
MSHLFVPSIQVTSGDGGVGGCSSGDRGDGGRLQVCADSTLYLTSRSPEIKISLRSVRGDRYNPFDIAKLLTPNIGAGGAGALAKTAENLKGQTPGTASKGDVGDRVPHFTVRDIRESKNKLQTPIHQVRDVRKLVKSSYHFVSLDNNEEHSRVPKQGPQQSPLAVSPIVIKCQSVNTNSSAKQSGNLIEASKRRAGDNMSEAQRSSPQVPVEGAKNGERATGRAFLVPVKQLNGDSSDVPAGVKIEMRAITQKQDLGDTGDRKPEASVANQAALEKLRAAVKTMEQLYVFDRNEWKRKTEPRPITDSHVLSLITSEEHGGATRAEPEEEEASNTERFLRSDSGSDVERSPPITPATAQPKVDRDVQKAPQAPLGCEERDVLRSQSLQNKNVSTQSQKTPTVGGCSKTPQVYASTQTPFGTKTIPPKAIRGPLSLKISPNYLTIPVKGHASDTKVTAGSGQSPESSTVAMGIGSLDIPPATIYHHALPAAMQVGHPQVVCLPPSVAPPPAVDPFQQMQRKMLLDPTTGHYYLVDTPVQPATRRLFDPETGQYVDVPMSQPPVTPLPMPMPLPPLALNSAAYGATYMIYPGFLPAPAVVPARTLHSQPAEGGDGAEHTGPQSSTSYMEGSYYIPTGKSHQSQHVTTRGAKPIISITSQQGPRIIAPPSFDGTTMSFVVEHR